MNQLNNLPLSVRVSQLQLGHQATIIQIHGSSRDIQRMNMLGLRKGISLTVVHGPGRRGAVVKVGGARIALSQEIIDQIEVSTTADKETSSL
ncbi:FeoA family protein [Celerinatantimonas yamalensis]|uniref:FeoA family protein n=1 Tax=Celerinatantimonas yamalensis TaxID=559956 RepID=A0ABW9G4B9_9GAMM